MIYEYVHELLHFLKSHRVYSKMLVHHKFLVCTKVVRSVHIAFIQD
jgi:hypothetical protein